MSRSRRRRSVAAGDEVWGALDDMVTPCRVLTVTDTLFGREVLVEVLCGGRMGEKHHLPAWRVDRSAAVLGARARGAWPLSE